MAKTVIHSDNPNLVRKHPHNRKTWACKCGVINEPEAPECKMILINEQGTDANIQAKLKKNQLNKIKMQVKEIDEWLASPEIG